MQIQTTWNINSLNSMKLQKLHLKILKKQHNMIKKYTDLIGKVIKSAETECVT